MNDGLGVLALSGGIGGAKHALGLYHALGKYELVVVCNTAMTYRYLGLHISPDIDTVINTLAGVVNRETEWGLADESHADTIMTTDDDKLRLACEVLGFAGFSC